MRHSWRYRNFTNKTCRSAVLRFLNRYKYDGHCQQSKKMCRSLPDGLRRCQSPQTFKQKTQEKFQFQVVRQRAPYPSETHAAITNHEALQNDVGPLLIGILGLLYASLCYSTIIEGTLRNKMEIIEDSIILSCSPPPGSLPRARRRSLRGTSQPRCLRPAGGGQADW